MAQCLRREVIRAVVGDHTLTWALNKKSRAYPRGGMQILKDVYHRNNMNTVPFKGFSRHFVGE